MNPDRKKVQLNSRAERKQFKDNLKIYLRINRITQRSICDRIGVTEQEFHNMLTGYQSSIPTKNYYSFDQFKDVILKELCITQL